MTTFFYKTITHTTRKLLVIIEAWSLILILISKNSLNFFRKYGGKRLFCTLQEICREHERFRGKSKQKYFPKSCERLNEIIMCLISKIKNLRNCFFLKKSLKVSQLTVPANFHIFRLPETLYICRRLFVNLCFQIFISYD